MMLPEPTPVPSPIRSPATASSSSTTYIPSSSTPAPALSELRQPPAAKFRLMISAAPHLWKSRGQKRSHNSPVATNNDNEEIANHNEGGYSTRPMVKLKTKIATAEAPAGETIKESFTVHPLPTVFATNKGCPAPATEANAASNPCNWSVYRVTDPDNRSSTTSVDSTVPAAKRPRSHSTSSSIVGLLVSEDEAPPSPNDATTSPTLSIKSLAPSPAGNNNRSPHLVHVPSPLASAPIMGVPLEPPSEAQALATVIPVIAPIPEVEMLSVDQVSDANGNNASNPKTQIAKARTKFLAEVEALGTEMNHVFRLGVGHGLGRSLGGRRGPSRLSRDDSRNPEERPTRQDQEDMDVDQ